MLLGTGIGVSQNVLALSSLHRGVGYVTKYIMKVNRAVIDHESKFILTIALLWIFRKRAYSVSKNFGLFLLVEMDKKKIIGQVDLMGDSIYVRVLVGFWAGELGVWRKKLSYKEFFSMLSSESFTYNQNL
jgi:hypothetical protein